jgi:two-component system, NarL family, response regulator NreC
LGVNIYKGDEKEMGVVNIILADDHTLFRESLKKLIESKVDYKVIGEAANGLELIALLKKIYADLVILDVSMPELRGIEAIPEIRTLHPTIKILILTMHNEKGLLYQAIAAGARGYLLKDDSPSELFAAIGKVGRGEIYVSPRMANGMIENWGQVIRDNGKIAEELEQLSNREREIVKLIAEGKKSKEIAGLLFISPRTVQNHRANVMFKLNLKNTAEIVKYALKNGYL